MRSEKSGRTSAAETVPPAPPPMPVARGTAAYNPMGNPPVQVKFAEPRASLAIGKTIREHTVPPCDAGIFLKPQGRP